MLLTTTKETIATKELEVEELSEALEGLKVQKARAVRLIHGRGDGKGAAEFSDDEGSDSDDELVEDDELVV